MVANIHLSPAPQSVGSCWYSEISHGGFIYTKSIAEHYKSLVVGESRNTDEGRCGDFEWEAGLA